MCNLLKKICAYIIAAALSIVSVFGAAVVAFSDNEESLEEMERNEQETRNAISSLEKQSQETKEAIDALNQQRTATAANVSSLQNQSAQLNSAYKDYSGRLEELVDEIEKTEEEMRKTSKAIIELNSQIDEKRNERETLYREAKEMIKAIYESGGDSLFVKILISSFSPRDMMKKAEYISSVVSYEQKVMKELKEIEDELQKEADELEAKQDEMDEYQDVLDGKQDELEELTEEVMNELGETNSSLRNEKSKMANFDEQLAVMNKKQAQIEESVAAAQAKLAQQVEARLARLEAMGKTEYLGGVYSASEEEMRWLAATVEAEAGNQSYTGKLAVASVIMNRVFSSSFPNDIIGVITQNMQFATYRSGKVQLFMDRGPSSSCVQAAQEAVNGARVGDYLFFMTQKWADYYRIDGYVMIGAHAFFKRWITHDPPPEEPAVEEQPQEQPEAQPEEQPQEQSEEQVEEQPQEQSEEPREQSEEQVEEQPE